VTCRANCSGAAAPALTSTRARAAGRTAGAPLRRPPGRNHRTTPTMSVMLSSRQAAKAGVEAVRERGHRVRAGRRDRLRQAVNTVPDAPPGATPAVSAWRRGRPNRACHYPGWPAGARHSSGAGQSAARELGRNPSPRALDRGSVRGASPGIYQVSYGRGGAWTAAYPFPAWSACAATSVPATGLSLRSPRAATDLFPAAGLVVPASRALSLFLSPLGKHLGRPRRPVAGPSCAALPPDRREGPRSPQAATRAAAPPRSPHQGESP